MVASEVSKDADEAYTYLWEGEESKEGTTVGTLIALFQPVVSEVKVVSNV